MLPQQVFTHILILRFASTLSGRGFKMPKKEIYVHEDKVLIQLSMEDCTIIAGSLLLLDKIDSGDEKLKNLADRITYQMIQKMKQREEES